jgi:hypothetical protein
MRFVAELFDFFEHGGLVFFGDFRFENDDHNFFYVARVITKKPQVTTCGLGCVFIERSLAQESLAKKIFTKPAGTKSKAAKIHAAKKVGKWKRHVKRALRSALCEPQQLRKPERSEVMGAVWKVRSAAAHKAALQYAGKAL